MVTRFSLTLLLIGTAASFSLMAGCGQTEQKPATDQDGVAEGGGDYNPHDVPITDQQKAELRQQTAQFSDAVATLKQFRTQVEQETAAGIPENPYEAHQALDKADLILQRLPEIARDSGVAKEHWETVNTSANELRTLFEKVHLNIDNQQDPDFAAVAEQIDENLAELEKIAAAQTTGS